MSEEKENQGFRVIDKRRFTEEGDSRESSIETVASKPASVETKAPVNAESKPASKPQTANQPVAKDQAGSAAQPRQLEEHGERVEFASFVVSLATQALALLGEIPNPETNEITVNIDAARQTIDILGMLEEKTKGNLTPDEERLQTEVLSSLRLAFVTKVRKGV